MTTWKIIYFAFFDRKKHINISFTLLKIWKRSANRTRKIVVFSGFRSNDTELPRYTVSWYAMVANTKTKNHAYMFTHRWQCHFAFTVLKIIADFPLFPIFDSLTMFQRYVKENTQRKEKNPTKIQPKKTTVFWLFQTMYSQKQIIYLMFANIVFFLFFHWFRWCRNHMKNYKLFFYSIVVINDVFVAVVWGD